MCEAWAETLGIGRDDETLPWAVHHCRPESAHQRSVHADGCWTRVKRFRRTLEGVGNARPPRQTNRAAGHDADAGRPQTGDAEAPSRWRASSEIVRGTSTRKTNCRHRFSVYRSGRSKLGTVTENQLQV